MGLGFSDYMATADGGVEETWKVPYGSYWELSKLWFLLRSLK